MCVATVLLATGMLPMTEPVTHLVLDPTDPFQEGFVVGKPWEPEY